MLSIANSLKGCRCLIPDLTGFGDTPHPEYPLTVDDYMDAVLQKLNEKNIDRFCIIAHSFGARIAIKIAAKYPERVSRLIMTGAAGIKPKRGLKYYFKVYLYKLKKRLGIKSNAGSEDYKALSGAMKGTFVNVVNEDLTALLPGIKADTLLVFGENDTATPLYMARKMEKLIPSAALIVYKDAGHYAYIERSAEFNAAVNSYLSTHNA